jgi:16S rRNA (cytidine1402-2'-O)-methyltransferase
MTNKGKLFLIPTVISGNTHEDVVAPGILKKLPAIRHFLVEELRTARRYLSSLKVYDTVETLSFSVLNKDTHESELPDLFRPVFEGMDVGVLSESGCPGIADPGALAVRFAHQNGIRVIPLVGPSSILLALMAAGLNGQNFAFHGYLPIEAKESARAIREFEKESRVKNQTQIFIETPYRNNTILKNLLKNLPGETQLCVALNVTGESEFISTRSVSKWQLEETELPKAPAVFLFLA